MKEFILFDNDGVLVHTEPLYYEANQIILKEMGIDLNDNNYYEIMIAGKSAFILAEEAGYSAQEIARERNRRNVIYQELIKERNVIIEGVEAVLDNLSKNFKMGIVTTSRREDFELIHHEQKLTKYMDFVLCVEDYPRAKPHPDPYLAGLKQFNTTPEKSIVVEDSERGLRSAVNAGIDCVIVDNAFTRHHDFSKAKHTIQTLNELERVVLY